MLHKFEEGSHIVLTTDHSPLGLHSGDEGSVWCLYDTEPPSYEVTFSTRDGREFDALMTEVELDRVAVVDVSFAVA